MPYAIQGTDKPGTGDLVAAHRADHLKYLDANIGKLLAAGPVMGPDGKTRVGTIILLDTEVQSEAEVFMANDPFNKAGLFEKVTVSYWRKSYFDHKRLV